MNIFKKILASKATPTAPPQAAPKAPKQSEPPLALVLLRSTPRKIDSVEIERKVTQLFQFRFEHGNPNATSFVVAHRESTALKTPDWFIMVHSMIFPYWKDPQMVAQQIGELRAREAVLKHKGWTSVDILQRPTDVDRLEGYRRSARLLAEFVDESCLAVFLPEFDAGVPFDVSMLDEVRAALRSENPLKALKALLQPGVIGISGSDPRMQQAVEEARRRYPEFVRAFRAKEGAGHNVKVPITVGEKTEFIWIEVTSLSEQTIRGKIGNEPVDLGALRLGDEVEVPVADLNDWIYMKPNEMVGGFTVKLLMDDKRSST